MALVPNKIESKSLFFEDNDKAKRQITTIFFKYYVAEFSKKLKLNKDTNLGTMLIAYHQSWDRKTFMDDHIGISTRSSQQFCKCL